MFIPHEQYQDLMFDDFVNNSLIPGARGIFCAGAVVTLGTGEVLSGCSGHIERDSALRPDNLDVGMVEVGTTFEGFVSEIGEPGQGSEILTADGALYRVARTDSNDGTFVKLIVTEVLPHAGG